MRTALDKRQPRQRKWGVAGTALLGLRLVVAGPQQVGLLEFLRELQESQAIVRISGGHHNLQLWFRWQRYL